MMCQAGLPIMVDVDGHGPFALLFRGVGNPGMVNGALHAKPPTLRCRSAENWTWEPRQGWPHSSFQDRVYSIKDRFPNTNTVLNKSWVFCEITSSLINLFHYWLRTWWQSWCWRGRQQWDKRWVRGLGSSTQLLSQYRYEIIAALQSSHICLRLGLW